MIPARVITVSDRCHAGTAEDLSGPLAARLLAEHGVEASVTVIPDEAEAIRAAITSAAASGARLVFTTGGTGLSPRDVTPEATEPLLATRIDGLADAWPPASTASPTLSDAAAKKTSPQPPCHEASSASRRDLTRARASSTPPAPAAASPMPLLSSGRSSPTSSTSSPAETTRARERTPSTYFFACGEFARA